MPIHLNVVLYIISRRIVIKTQRTRTCGTAWRVWVCFCVSLRLGLTGLLSFWVFVFFCIILIPLRRIMRVFYRPAWEWRVYFRFLDLPYRQLTKDGGLLLSGSTFIFILSKFLHLYTATLFAFFSTTAFEGRLCARLSEVLDFITFALDRTAFKPYQNDSLLQFLKSYLHKGVAQPSLVTRLTDTNFFGFTLCKAVNLWQVSVRGRALSVRLCRSFPELFIWEETWWQRAFLSPDSASGTC